MECHSLELAKQSEKEQDWEKAAAYYAQYFNHNREKCDAPFYVSYAKSLIHKGNMHEAEQVLKEGQFSFPESEAILKTTYDLHQYSHQWKKAKDVMMQLTELNPEKAEYYFMLGKSHSYLNEDEQAKEAYLTGLSYKNSMTLDQLIKQIKSGLTDQPEAVHSEYVFLKGKNNYGAFIHTFKQKRYFTKIAEYDVLAQREELFYKQVCDDFPFLQEMVPGYIHSMNIHNLLYLTTEMIDTAPITKEWTQSAILTSKKMSAIPYAKLNHHYPNPSYRFGLKNKPNPVTFFFTKIHLRKYNKRLFSLLYKVLEQHHYPRETIRVIEKMESLIMKNTLYRFISPERHYSLIHGDFNQSNPVISKQDHHVKLLDWETFKIGIHFTDIVRFLTSSRTPFAEIKTVYLNNDDTGAQLSTIEKIFFLYLLILLYIFTIRENKIAHYMDTCIDPALAEMEELVQQFISSDSFHMVTAMTDRNQHLKNDNLLLSEEVKQEKMKNEEMQSSKSWRLTAPLRRLKNWFRR